MGHQPDFLTRKALDSGLEILYLIPIQAFFENNGFMNQTSNDVKHVHGIRKLLYIAVHVMLIAVIIHIAFCFVRYASVSPPSYDGAMNLNVAVSFMQGRGYGFVYDSFFPFPAQTDGPFILPAALVLWLGGITPLTTQLVNLGYLMTFAIAAYILLRCLHLPSWVSLIGVILCLRTPGIDEYALNGYGEIPCLFFFLVGMILILYGLREDKPRSLLLMAGGMAFGLSVITKVVSLIMVGPALFFLIVYCFVNRVWRPAVSVTAGFIIPVLGWELFRFIQVGNITNYLTWWRLQLHQANLQSGLHERLAGPAGIAIKAATHLKHIFYQTGLPPFLTVVMLAIIMIVGGIQGRRLWKKGDRIQLFVLATMASIIGAYFIWWICITPTHYAWLRRLMNGLILMMMFSLVVVYYMGRFLVTSARAQSLLKNSIIGIIISIILTSQVLLIRTGGIFTGKPYSRPDDIEQIAVAKKVKQLPEHAVLFGFGWWKAPVLMLFSGRQIMNFNRWSPSDINALPETYLVIDRAAKILSHEYRDILDVITSQVVLDTPNAGIFRILSVRPYRPFTPSERTAADIAAGFDAVKENYKYVRGFYVNEGTHRWCMPEAGFLLRRTNQDRLRIILSMPDELYQTLAAPGDLHVDVYSGGCINKRLPLSAGRQTVDIPLGCPVSSEASVLEISVSVNARMPFIQQIDFNIPRLGFRLESARLVSSR